MPQLVRTLLWQRQDCVSTEIFSLWRDVEGWQLRGLVILSLDGVPTRVRYGVICDARWLTTDVHIAVGSGSRERPLHLTAQSGHWRDRDGALPALEGCHDVDIAVTPATNSLAINRLGLTVGESVQIRAAYLRLPELTVMPAEQTYTRLSQDVYRYRGASGFQADLEVDNLGLVREYGSIWRRVAEQDEGPSG